MMIYESVDYSKEKPLLPGLYIVDTKSKHRTNTFLASFNGVNFDVNNQIVINWYKKRKYDN